MTKKKAKAQKSQKSNIAIRKRGCGWPIAGGSYLYVEPGFKDTPIWQLVIDPTMPIPEGFGMSSIGMVLKERIGSKGQTVYDLWDWIGGEAYPNPLDWLLEVQQLGFHQKVNPEQMKWLSEESYYVAVHARAGYVDPTLAYMLRDTHPEQPYCPGNHEGHKIQPDPEADTFEDCMHLGTCPGLFFSDVIKGSKPEPGSRVTVREMPSFSWDGFVLHEYATGKDPAGTDHLEYQPAAFFKLPIGRWAQILMYQDMEHQEEIQQKAMDLLSELDEKFKRITLVSLDGG